MVKRRRQSARPKPHQVLWRCAWVVETLRNKGLAARFVVGYLVFADPKKGGLGVGYHAWAEVYLPGAGWVGLDPTSGSFTTECHVPLSYGVRPEDAQGLEGRVFGTGRPKVQVEMTAVFVK